ncbi:MAG: LexA family transcriptional regulator [Flavobacterium sp.]|nr:LexA family transcriptional regulator [Flavobacterium sp.]
MEELQHRHASNVIDRLKKLLKIKRDAQLAAILKVRANTISTWKKRNTLDHEAIILVCENYKFDLNYILLNIKKSSASATQTPILSRDVQFQYALGNDTEALLEALPKYHFPFINGEDSRAFQVISNNMFPLIEENSYVICESTETIITNIPVVIVSRNKGIFINKLYPNPFNEGEFILSSENEGYRDVILEASDIDEIWKIRAQLSYNINHDNKIKFISDSLKKINAFVATKTVSQ